MSIDDRCSISKILNRTNFKIMAWYFGPRESAQSGLKRFRLAFKMPMQSTGKEKFSVYCYYKTQKYDPNDPWSDDESECEEDEDFEEENEQEQMTGKTTKSKQMFQQASEKNYNNIEIKRFGGKNL